MKREGDMSQERAARFESRIDSGAQLSGFIYKIVEVLLICVLVTPNSHPTKQMAVSSPLAFRILRSFIRRLRNLFKKHPEKSPQAKIQAPERRLDTQKNRLIDRLSLT